MRRLLRDNLYIIAIDQDYISLGKNTIYMKKYVSAINFFYSYHVFH